LEVRSSILDEKGFVRYRGLPKVDFAGICVVLETMEVKLLFGDPVVEQLWQMGLGIFFAARWYWRAGFQIGGVIRFCWWWNLRKGKITESLLATGGQVSLD
jgi:hypothetical protein